MSKAVARIFVWEGFDLPFPPFLCFPPFFPLHFPFSALFLLSLPQSFPLPNPGRESGGAL